ncbi:MAG: DNA recombination protein RmuC, partial [Candidatus Omnitrophica bacterium]|nr:DNA recombination protein RmuC [Candidatus Omnitrophota bacterium]
MWTTLLLAVFVGSLVAILFGFWLLRVLPAATVKTLQSTATGLLEQSKQQLALERQQGVHDLDERRMAVESTVKNLEGQLLRYETLMRHFETDRDQKFGALKTELDRTLRANEQLQHTTSSLVAVLGNSRVRGQWGQKMAEDILRFCGLQEGVHYRREQGMSSGRPDYTFLLPDQHELYMDVKFPLERYLKAMESQDSASQQMHREAFLRDVKEHLREMERRGYQSSSEQGVDYLLIFIPNEQVYGLVNEWMPSLIDECLQKQMILCGPWTLYAV